MKCTQHSDYPEVIQWLLSLPSRGSHQQSQLEGVSDCTTTPHCFQGVRKDKIIALWMRMDCNVFTLLVDYKNTQNVHRI